MSEYEDEAGMFNIETDFNVDDEFKPPPLVPNGTYHAHSTGVKFDAGQQAIVWTFVLHDNGGYMSDGESPIDGATVFFRNWLPREGDELNLNKSGNLTKRQSKINMIQQFSKELGISMNTKEDIITALTEQTWIGIEADLQISTREWEGQFSNNVDRVRKSSL